MPAAKSRQERKAIVFFINPPKKIPLILSIRYYSTRFHKKIKLYFITPLINTDERFTSDKHFTADFLRLVSDPSAVVGTYGVFHCILHCFSNTVKTVFDFSVAGSRNFRIRD